VGVKLSINACSWRRSARGLQAFDRPQARSTAPLRGTLAADAQVHHADPRTHYALQSPVQHRPAAARVAGLGARLDRQVDLELFYGRKYEQAGGRPRKKLSSSVVYDDNNTC
jgi:hypothetical protein